MPELKTTRIVRDVTVEARDSHPILDRTTDGKPKVVKSASLRVDNNLVAPFLEAGSQFGNRTILELFQMGQERPREGKFYVQLFDILNTDFVVSLDSEDGMRGPGGWLLGVRNRSAVQVTVTEAEVVYFEEKEEGKAKGQGNEQVQREGEGSE
ncbi:MAG: hypothetical protein ACE5JI_17745 [Acidobacteriota bacterium]